MNTDALKTKITRLARFLWLVKQAENPPKMEGRLGQVIEGTTTVARCCLGNGCLALMHESFRRVDVAEEWMHESVELPQEVAKVLNITPCGEFNGEDIKKVDEFITGQFGEDCFDEKESRELNSLIGINDGTSLNHEQIGKVIQRCFEMGWFMPFKSRFSDCV